MFRAYCFLQMPGSPVEDAIRLTSQPVGSYKLAAELLDEMSKLSSQITGGDIEWKINAASGGPFWALCNETES